MRKNKFQIFLLASVFSINIFSFSSVNASSNTYDDNYFNNYSFSREVEEITENTELDDNKTLETAKIEKPSSGASNAEVAKYIRDTLNSSSSLENAIQLKGKKQNEDGTSYVAIRYDDGENERDVVVTLDASGDFTGSLFTDNEDSRKLQLLYDEIVYGQSSSTAHDIDDLNSILHEDESSYMGSLADFLGVDVGTASATATGAMSVFGMAILGAGTNSEKKTEIFNQAVENKKKKLTRPSGKSKSNRHYERTDAGVFVDNSRYGVGSLTQPTQNFLNTLSAKFYEETKVVLSVTSTLRPDDAGSWHSQGIAFDVANDEFLNGANGYSGDELRVLYKQMAIDLGGDPLDEYPGGEGEQYARGWNFHITVHNQDEWA